MVCGSLTYNLLSKIYKNFQNVKGMRWAGQVAHTEVANAYKIVSENLKEKEYLKYLCID
jgi:hypothetical protein